MVWNVLDKVVHRTQGHKPTDTEAHTTQHKEHKFFFILSQNQNLRSRNLHGSHQLSG